MHCPRMVCAVCTFVSKTTVVCPPPQALAYARTLPHLHLTLQTHYTKNKRNIRCEKERN